MTKNKHLEITIIIDAYIDPKYNIEETQVTEIMNTGELESDWNLNYWNFGVVKQKRKRDQRPLFQNSMLHFKTVVSSCS